jgi:orotidine-5'-phosphate decarboxylase
MTEFAQRLAARVSTHGPLCIGIDPSRALLAKCALPDSAEGALAFGRRVLEAADWQLAIVKPQSAYFERFGSAGVRALEELIADARQREVLVLLDVKRGDIDSTGEAYGEALFLPASPLRVDAATFSPYLGIEALERAIDLAAEHGSGVFVVVRSSNREGEALQNAVRSDGRTVARAICDTINALNARLSSHSIGPVGAVVGATCEDAPETIDALPGSWILAPGVGAQGASIDDVRERMAAALGRVLPNVSRAVLAGGAESGQMRATIKALKEQSRALLKL